MYATLLEMCKFETIVYFSILSFIRDIKDQATTLKGPKAWPFQRSFLLSVSNRGC